MFYVYLLHSESNPNQIYTGFTTDLRARIRQHNSGKSAHTRNFAPWQLMAYVAFSSRVRAEQFEKYLKSGSGRAFAKRHLWDAAP